jgi:hypothetical protein
LQEKNITPVLVHMGAETPELAQTLATYTLEALPRIADPDRLLYKAVGLKRGQLAQLFGWDVWVKGFKASFIEDHGVGALVGDGFQLSGWAWLLNGQLATVHPHANAAEPTPFVALANQCAI